MLTVKRNITLNGVSIIEGRTASQFVASIDSENPNDMTINRYIVDKEIYKPNRAKVNEEYIEFEDMAYELQEEMSK